MKLVLNIFAQCAGFWLLYIALYHLSDVFASVQGVEGLVSFFYLPAFIRLLGFLIVGYWIIPTLFAASVFLSITGAYDLGPGLAPELIIAAFTAVGGPFGVFLASRLANLKPSLSNLTPLRLLCLSVGCAMGNAVFHYFAWVVIGDCTFSPVRYFAIFFGDFVGTWAIIYLIKTGLTLYTCSSRSS